MSHTTKSPVDGFDEFGLPRISLLGEQFESPRSRAIRTKKVEAFAKRAFSAVAEHLGHEAAAQIFAAAAKRKSKTAGRKKQISIDDEVLRIYNLERSNCIKYNDEKSIPSLPRRIGEQLNIDRPGDYGPSAQAIEKRIWRILKASIRTCPH